ncbi:hypothetical protein LXL04_016509 [Taraxacum kok-saghyz]
MMVLSLNMFYYAISPKLGQIVSKSQFSRYRSKNNSSSHIAFKFQTTAPKSCHMRPPGGTLAPGETIIATIFKFVEQPEKKNVKQQSQRSKVKFKIMSLKVTEGTNYVPELFEKKKDDVVVESIDNCSNSGEQSAVGHHTISKD